MRAGIPTVSPSATSPRLTDADDDDFFFRTTLGRQVDYEGVATTLDWDEHGDLREGYIGVWRFTPDEGIEEVETVFFRDVLTPGA